MLFPSYWNIFPLTICEKFGHEEFEGIKRLQNSSMSFNLVILARCIAWKDKPILRPYTLKISRLSLRRVGFHTVISLHMVLIFRELNEKSIATWSLYNSNLFFNPSYLKILP